MFKYIAEIWNSAPSAGADDITTFLGPLKVHRCWSNMQFRKCLSIANIWQDIQNPE